MIATRSNRPAETVSAPSTPPDTGFFSGWARFWFTPVDPLGLHIVRVLAGLLFLSWLLPFAGHVDALFGLQGWFDQQAYVDVTNLPPEMRRTFGWSILYVCDTPALVTAFYWFAVGVLVLFTLGIGTRVTSVLTWAVIASFTTNPAVDYDGDALLLVLAFYLMIGYVGLGQRSSGLSPLARLLGSAPSWWPGRRREEAQPSLSANLALRLLQVHFAIIIVTAGLHKLQFGDWWAGVSFWYPMYPAFASTFQEIRAGAAKQREFLFGYLSLGAYAVLAWQTAFPLYAWRPRWRFLLVGGAVVGWLGTAFLYHLPLLGPAFLIGSLTFVTAREWHTLFGLMARLPGLGWLATASTAAGDVSLPASRGESVLIGRNG